MRILLVPASDWLGHPLLSRLHFIFERLAECHEVHVIRYPIPLWKRKRESKAIIHEAKGLAIRDLSLYYVINSPLHLWSFGKILKTCKPDVVVFANILTGAEAVILSKQHGIPLVCDYLDHFPESASLYYNNPIVRALVAEVVLKVTKWNLARADCVVTVSDSFLNWLKNLGIQKVSLIPNGVDIENFMPTDKNTAREELGIKELKNKVVITYVGSVERWYDLDVVAHATSILNHAGISSVFQIIGGRLTIETGDSVHGRGADIFQTGFVDHKLVPLHISASDACVLPLKKMAKNLTRPVKILEYFSCGKPVLSLPNLELEHAFGDAITFFHDADELSKILLRLVRAPDEFSSKIENGYKYARENSWDNHTRRYGRLLKAVLEDYSNGLRNDNMT